MQRHELLDVARDIAETMLPDPAGSCVDYDGAAADLMAFWERENPDIYTNRVDEEQVNELREAVGANLVARMKRGAHQEPNT